jgi:hypothetical protein
MTTLTNQETKTYKILVRLGDSKELALKTVISERSKEAKKLESKSFYSNAYSN